MIIKTVPFHKFLLLAMAMITIASCKSKKATVAKPEIKKTDIVAIEKLDTAEKNRAYDAGTRILNACNTSKFKPFTTAEATSSVIQNTTQDRLTKTCLKFRLKYGDFKDLELVEVINSKKDNSHIYRYKARYEKKIANKELRVTMNEDQKVSAIKSLDWVDQYQ